MKPLTLVRDCLAAAVFIAMPMCVLSAYADVAVIVSAKSPIARLTAEQVTRIFLAKTVAFPGGAIAVPIDQPEGAAVRDEFYAKIAGKSASQLSAYWTRIIFTGDGNPPRQLANDSGVRRAVANDLNAIGYIDKGAVDGSVRVLLAP